MTNPNNAVGTNAAYGGRTSVNAFNDDLNIYSRGILSGWACSPKSGMTVQIGGNGADRDAAVAEDNAGNKTSINNISGSPIDVTIPAAPATNNRIDLIVAYADNPPSGTSTVVDNPAACGIIVVSGTAAASPTEPTNAAIRSAITTDGATGSTAYYVILAKIRVGTGVTTIGSGVITQGDVVISNAQLADSSVTSDKIDWETLPGSAGATTVSGKMSGTSWANIGNAFKAPSNGLYFVSAIFNQNGNPGETSFIMEGRIVAAGNALSAGVPSVANYAGNHNCTITLSRMTWLTAGQTIQMQGRTENWSGGVDGRMEIKRVY